MRQDKRTVHTKSAIIHALVKLINDKGFNNINVTDLTREASIGRGTFYIHYLDKFDLLNKIENKLLSDIKDVLNNLMPEELKSFTQSDESISTPSDIVIKTLNYFYDNSKLLSALLSENGDPYLFGRIKKIFSDVTDASFAQFDGKVTLTDEIPKDYVKEIMLNHLMNIVVYWISKDHPESPNNLAKIIIASQYIAPNDLIKVNKK
ncbi:TetR/AcrR family transcriptional regulator [Apilactobacillus micheneri]|uniref:TetR/AcrR family transcriptional regulator n=1 Tax=Apilactobacillus micheneri TaxID=1899430 RepID=A0ABY2YW94_9LACO|nr:TetR/AcrR family transcriptional regulator [Apilactobacillus micheneri]TPR24587.1 TetR/AcrR family transcriptional regulator [Apilactobacillus micheneri]TPR25898.1 TetR/AcrR family transcriptional regulator [Apilactobacillus micheneri]TPR28088.1 TetR/AcrR family transcriptional regulator [Apilactobacillus micheneri]TPR29579.1 TetR/AcrR family transcriptional regulator [Apilactobacillus micheneri]TPR30365.1 TetR/AcrR family transcriptional regulator [Apilactobacillus micheneri]